MVLKKLFNHDITIQPTANAGLVVRMGCATLCYTSLNAFQSDLKEYLADPDKWEKEYNRTHLAHVGYEGD